MTDYDVEHTILVVDDQPANVQLLERLLAGAGYRDVVTTTDARDADVLFERHRPDLVLLDLHMPRMDGFEVMTRLTAMMPPGDYRPILVLTADVTVDAKQRALRDGASDFLTKPFDAAEVVARVANLLRTRALHLQLRRHGELLEERVRERTADLWRTVRELEQTHDELRAAQDETIHSLSLAAEFRDDETSRHIERMSRYCAVIAKAFGFGDDGAETARLASKMHDVGKIGIPDTILRKPGRLTAAEFETMKEHARIGYEILSGATSPLASMAAAMAWTHHERFDGTGYPRGLAEEDIPVEGRIAAVADVFDALTTDRVYREALEIDEALTLIRDGRGTQFDPSVLTCFFDVFPAVLDVKRTLDQPALRAQG